MPASTKKKLNEVPKQLKELIAEREEARRTASLSGASLAGTGILASDAGRRPNVPRAPLRAR